jgi:hypothetical protein
MRCARDARRGTRSASAVRAPFTHPQVCHYVVFETTQGASPEYLITNLPLPFGLRERLFLEYNELDVPSVVASQDKGFRIIDIDGRCERAGAPLQRSESTQRATREWCRSFPLSYSSAVRWLLGNIFREGLLAEAARSNVARRT